MNSLKATGVETKSWPSLFIFESISISLVEKDRSIMTINISHFEFFLQIFNFKRIEVRSFSNCYKFQIFGKEKMDQLNEWLYKIKCMNHGKKKKGKSNLNLILFLIDFNYFISTFQFFRVSFYCINK